MTGISNEFLMTHFIMEAPPPAVPHDSLARAGSENLWIKPVKATYDVILDNLEKIGDGWNLRSEHQDKNKRERTKSKLEGKRTHCWYFMRGEEAVGFCIAIKAGFDSSLSDKFGLSARNSEIYKVGLFPEHQHNGLGHVFLPMVQGALLNGQAAVPSRSVQEIKPSDKLYLNTRTTNSTDSRDFYKKLGWTLRGEDRWVNPISEGTQLSARPIPEKDIEQDNKEVRRQITRQLRPIGSGLYDRRSALG